MTPRLVVRLAKAHATGYPLAGRRRWRGLEISIEAKKGQYRPWRDENGREGKTLMRYDYGYIRGTEGVDREPGKKRPDHLDVYVGPYENARYVYVVHQVRPDTGEHDEDKVMLGFRSAREAKAAYLAHIPRSYYGGMTRIPAETFVRLAREGRLRGRVVMGEPLPEARSRELRTLVEIARKGRLVRLPDGGEA